MSNSKKYCAYRPMATVNTRGLDNVAIAVLAGVVTGVLVVLFRSSLLAYEAPNWFRVFQVLLAVVVVGLLFGLAYEATESRLVMLVAHGAASLVFVTVGFVVVGTFDIVTGLVVLVLLPIVTAASLTYAVSPAVRGTAIWIAGSVSLVLLYCSLLLTGLVGAVVEGELSALPLLVALTLVFAVYRHFLLGFVRDAS